MYCAFSVDSTLAASATRCDGAAVAVAGFFTLNECASKCKDMIPNGASFIYFMHAVVRNGASSTKCQGLKCECKCNTKTTCTQKAAGNWNLYTVSKGKILYYIPYSGTSIMKLETIPGCICNLTFLFITFISILWI